MYMPRIPTRPADIYTVKILEPGSRPNLLRDLRNIVAASGGTVIVELMERSGFM